MSYKFKIGDKVVPVSKTCKGWGNLRASNAWYSAKCSGQPFLYVIKVGVTDLCGRKHDYSLDENPNSEIGDYFNDADLLPYKEKAQ